MANYLLLVDKLPQFGHVIRLHRISKNSSAMCSLLYYAASQASYPSYLKISEQE